MIASILCCEYLEHDLLLNNITAAVECYSIIIAANYTFLITVSTF